MSRPLDVKAAEERAKRTLAFWGRCVTQDSLAAQEFLALLALARDLAAFADRNDDEQHADERHALLTKAREAGLLS